MKRRLGKIYRGLASALCILPIPCSWMLPLAGEEIAMLTTGASRGVINPALNTFIAGDKLNRRFAVVHEDIYAKAAYFQNGAEAVSLVSIDCIGLTYPHVQAIRKRASELLGHSKLAPKRVIVCSTHCHSGPDVVGIWGPELGVSGRDEAYMEFLVETAAQQVRIAAGKAVPVTARYGSGPHEQAWVENICEPGVLDDELSVLQFLDAKGANVLTLTNFACHPTILDGVHDAVAADYVGGLYRGMSAAFGGEHLFLQGAVGAWVQPDKGDRSFDLADKYGRAVAARAQALLAAGKTLDSTEIAFAHKQFGIPLENEGWKQLSRMGVFGRDLGGEVTTEVAWFRIGEAQFATHPGETPPAYSLQTKAWMKPGAHFVIGLGLDALGYVLKPEYFEENAPPHAEYLTSMSAGKTTGPAILDALRSVIPAQ
ncbi:MAG: alkaline ceramidase [Candidatus Hydrogenedentes bacterium]|nr:alkaline ceramidase [Candidatus Hydrogenedentota bacterium]